MLKEWVPAGFDVSICVTIRYYALLKDERGLGEETLETNALSAAELYNELKDRFSLSLPCDNLRIAANDQFVEWSHLLKDRDKIVFIPPVAGG